MPAPRHPGTILREQFLEPQGITTYDFAKKLYTPEGSLEVILEGRAPITWNISRRLAQILPPDQDFWLDAQYEWDQAHKKK